MCSYVPYVFQIKSRFRTYKTFKMTKSIFLIAILIFSFFACQKDINLNVPDRHEEQLFVESILYVGETPKVFLSKSVSFFNEKVTPQEVFVRDAIVQITEGNNNYILEKDSTFDKFRCRWNPFYTSNFIVEKNKTYQLKINQGGQEITAETSTDLKQITIAEVEYTPEFFDVFGGHDGVIIRFKDAPGEGDNYRFQMDRWLDTSRYHAHVFDGFINDCVSKDEVFFTTDLGRSVFSDFGIDGTDFELYMEVSFEYRKGDTATIYMQNLDKHAASFYHDLDRQLETIRNPFVEPAFLHSTVEGGFGMFGAALRSDPVKFIYPRDNP